METMHTVTVEQAQAGLPGLIAALQPGEAVLITAGDRPVARLVAEGTAARKPRTPGTAAGKLTIAEDDDAHLDDFREYMP